LIGGKKVWLKSTGCTVQPAPSENVLETQSAYNKGKPPVESSPTQKTLKTPHLDDFGKIGKPKIAAANQDSHPRKNQKDGWAGREKRVQGNFVAPSRYSHNRSRTTCPNTP
jgi:hypothetical protein